MKSAVIGLGFGDEGKGLITDYLCSKSDNPLVVRYSGGQQAGHTVVRKGVHHIFSNFGSGTLSSAPTYWSKFCTIDPIGLINELRVLLSKGISPTLYIDSACPVTTPYDTLHNQTHDNTNGTCGVGVGSTIAREESFYSLVARDLCFPSVLDFKLKMISEFYKTPNVSLQRFFESVFELIKSSHILIVDGYVDQDNVIFEGSQGLMLDKNIGFFPNVTRGNVGTKNILSFNNNFKTCLVTRAYQTRHGNGIMTNENIPHNILLNPNETNITNKYQGEFRRTLLDVDLLEYAISRDEYIRNDKNKVLAITCLDHIKDEYRFTHKGNVVYCNSENDFIEKISSILDIKKLLISHSPDSSLVQEK
jgi:adenylosuccinate synthase